MSKKDGIVDTKATLAFGFGDFFGGGSFLIIGTLFMFYLTQVVGLKPALAGSVVLVGKIWDAISDPLFGCISDRTKSRYGRRRVYFLAGILPVFVTYFFLWMTFHFQSQWAKFLYYTLAYIMFCTVYTMLMVPYNSLMTEMTTDYKKRSNLSAAKMGFSQFSALIAGTIPGYIVNTLYKDNPEKGFMLVGLFFGIAYAIPWIVVFLGTWEDDTVAVENTKTLSESFKQLFSLFKNRTYKIHILMYIFAYSAMDILSASFIYYVTYVMGRKEIFTLCLGSMLIFQLLLLPLYFHIANKIGKGKVYTIGASITVLVLMVFLFVPNNSPKMLLIILSACLGVGFCPIIAMPWAMLPESSDVDELLHGDQRTGAVSGTFTLTRKMVQAVILWLFGLLLAAIGFTENAPTQSVETVKGLKIIFSIAPLIFIAIGLIISLSYPVTPHTFKICRKELDRVRAGGNPEEADNKTRKVCSKLMGHEYPKETQRK